MRTTNQNTPIRKSNGNSGTKGQTSLSTTGKPSTDGSINRRNSSKNGQNSGHPNSTSNKGERQKSEETKKVFSSDQSPAVTSKRSNNTAQKAALSKNAVKPLVQKPATAVNEVFNWYQAGIICTLDAKKYSVTHSEAEISAFIKRNQFAYYMASNSWMLLLRDLSGDTLPEISRTILGEGLAPVITLANSLSNSLIEGVSLPSSPFGFFVKAATRLHDDQDVLKVLLQGLRYLKRFSPECTNSLIQDELIGFQRRNTSMKLYDRESLPMYHVLGLRHTLDATFKGWKKAYANHQKDFDWFSSLPSNATADTGNTLTQKWVAVLERIPFASQLTPPRTVAVNSLTTAAFEKRVCKIAAIPKSYKARRIIASEECYRQTKMSCISDTLATCLSNKRGKFAPGGRVLLHDQDRNRQLARQGSIDNSLATLDCSAASDTVSWWLVREVFPPELFHEMDQLRSTHLELKELSTNSTLTKVLYMFSSMGSRMTFPVETILFWGIACYACNIAANLLGEKLDVDQISVYGDDTIVPSKYAETVLHYLRVFGFTPNVEKSFFKEEGFRESCGIECYHGFDVSSKYFPRSIVSDDVNGAMRLISLQHRVYQHRECSNFLCSVLSTRFAVLYTSPNSRSQSLWSDYPTLKYRKVPRNLYKLDDNDAYNYALLHSVKEDYLVETHVSTTYKSCDNPVTMELAEQLAYLTFLKYGPRYETKLDELLGITQKPLQRAAYATGSTVELRNS